MNTAIERNCRRLARQIVKEEYRVIDEIWATRVRHSSVAPYYDAVTIKEINRRMPNLIVKTGGSPLDELAHDYGFESTCDLMDKFLYYTNKAVAFERYYSQILSEYSGESDVPF